MTAFAEIPPGAGTVVLGPVAAGLAAEALDELARKRRRDGVRPEDLIAQLRDACRRAAPDRVAEVLPTPLPTPSEGRQFITVQDAARLLGIGERRGRQLVGPAGPLRGIQQPDRTWRVDPQSVEDELARRRQAEGAR